MEPMITRLRKVLPPTSRGESIVGYLDPPAAPELAEELEALFTAGLVMLLILP